jgi:ATP-binding cassette subfamily B protein
MSLTALQKKEVAFSQKNRSKVLFWILSYLAPYKVPTTLFIIFGILISAIVLSIPKFIQYFIDVVFLNKDLVKFLIVLLIIGILFVFMIILTAFRNKFERILQEKPSNDILGSLFDHLRKLGFSYYEQHPTGETLSLFRDEVINIQTIYREYLPNIILHVTMCVISVSLLIHTHLILSLVVIPCILSYYLIGPFIEKRQILWAKEAQKRRIETNKKLFDSISALLELRAYGAQEWNNSLLRSKITQEHKADMMDNVYGYSRGTLKRLITGIGALVMFAIGFYLVKNGDLSTGEFVAFAILYFAAISNITNLITLLTEQGVFIVQAEKLYQFMKETPSVVEASESVQLQHVEGRITFLNVHFSYPHQERIINGFELDISPGEKVALVGYSGNGKSTLIKLLGRFYDPNVGAILLDSVPLTSLSFSQLRDTIGFVFQETFLFGKSIYDNIHFGNPEADNEEVIRAAKAAYAHDFIMEMPQQYDTLVGERGIKLSGGQKQRIAIARMFIKNPSVIVLDEATSALDNKSEYEVQKALDALMTNRTTITVAHRLSTVRYYDRILVLENGCIVEIGTYDELVAKKSVFHHLLMGQRELEGSEEHPNE